MKRYCKILAITAVMACGPATIATMAADKAKAEQTAGTPAITFVDKVYDFGMVAENGGPVSHEFEFTNTGDAPLLIISATAQCGCTRPTYSTDPIAPGKKGKIKVTYLPQGRPGEFQKTVRVRTNIDNKKITLKIKGTVKK